MSDIPYRNREEEKRVLLGLKRLEALLALRYLASAPGAAEMYLPLPFVSPPVGYRIEALKTTLKGKATHTRKPALSSSPTLMFLCYVSVLPAPCFPKDNSTIRNSAHSLGGRGGGGG